LFHFYKARLGQTELTYMLSILSRIPELLGEGVMFGSGVVGRAVASCLQAAGGQAASEEAWLAWAGREPVELVWLTTAYRYRHATQEPEGGVSVPEFRRLRA
jgi:hypothetical protein